MAASYAAALLDELMGRNRDVNPSEKREPHWSDPEVCKSFLCGFCPHHLFTNTRADLGRCDKIHDEDFRESYRKSEKFEKMGYEEGFTKYLQSLIVDVDKRIRRGEQRLALSSQPTPIPTTQQMTARTQKIKELTSRIEQLVEEAEALGCEGNVDQAQNMMVVCDKLKDEREGLLSLNDAERSQLESANEPLKAMQVCATCGALLVQNDTHLRMDEHVIGKQHMGYAQIRSYLASRQQAGQQLSSDIALSNGNTSAELSISTRKSRDASMAKYPSNDDSEVLIYESDNIRPTASVHHTVADWTSIYLPDDRMPPAPSLHYYNDWRRSRMDSGRSENREERRHRSSTQTSSTSSSRHRSRSKDRSRHSPSPDRRHERHSDAYRYYGTGDWYSSELWRH